MFLQIPLALALAATFLSLTIAATLPSYLVISVVNSTGVTIGSLTGYGNFSHPGPSYPFRSAPSNTTADYASLHGYYSCDAAAGGILACGDSSGGASESSFSVSTSCCECGFEYESLVLGIDIAANSPIN